MKRCDLHIHSTYSDGSYTPKEIIEEAKAKGIDAVILTDHNTVRGMYEFLSAAEDAEQEYAVGVEFSCEFRGREVHLIAMFLDSCHYNDVERMTSELARAKREKNIELAAALARDGYNISYEELEKKYPYGNINRAHIAAALVDGGYVKSTSEAFEGVLSEGGGYYTPPTRLCAIELIKKIDSMRALSCIAHPYLSFDSDSELEEFLALACEAGLDAMETRYTKYDAQTQQKASDTARRFGLLESGGSDFHGSVKPGTELGYGYGELCVPYEFYEKLKARAIYKKTGIG